MFTKILCYYQRSQNVSKNTHRSSFFLLESTFDFKTAWFLTKEEVRVCNRIKLGNKEA